MSYNYGIASGPTADTNYPMVADIAAVCGYRPNKIQNVTSDGSLDNIAKVYADRNTQMGLAQADALVYMAWARPEHDEGHRDGVSVLLD